MTPTPQTTIGPHTRAARPARTAAIRVAAGLVLLVLVVGVPIALLVIAPLGWPAAWPTWDELVSAVMRPDDGRLALGAIRLVAWGAWAAFTWSVILETAAAVHRTTTRPRVYLGGFQRLAATLVGAALLSLTTPTAGVHADPRPTVHTAPAVPGPTEIAAPAPATDAADGTTDAEEPTADAGARSTDGGADQPRTVQVRAGESLWSIAADQLGDGNRWPEIFALNAGRTQPDGRHLSDPDAIDIGWQLQLPNQKTAAQTTEAATTVVVAPGDTLAEIARTHLGDPDRYPEIFALNAGVEQPDGDMLLDPDLIHPGWVLTLPATTGSSMAAAASASSVPAPRVTTDAAQTTTDAPARVEAGPGAPAMLPDATPPATDASTDTAAATTDASVGGLAATSPAPPLDEASDPNTAEAHDTSAGEHGLYLGLTALAAAGLIGELARRRRLQHRTRRTGARIPRPAPGSEADVAERVWRTAPTPLSLAQIRTTLDTLAEACFAAERDLPRVGAVELSTERMTLHLTEPEPHPMPPFASTDQPTQWTAPTATLADLEPPTRDGLAAEPYPALVALGHTTTATVLLNLEAAGTLHLHGDPETVDAALRALVAEVATSELSGRIGITATAEFTPLARACAPARVQAGPPPLAAAQLADRLADTGHTLGVDGLDDTLQARSDRSAPDLWLPVIYLDDHPATTCRPWSGSVLITRAETAQGWALEIDPEGHATLPALGLEFTIARLTAEGLGTITQLLTTAAPDPEPAPPGLPAPGVVEAAEALDGIGPIDTTATDETGAGIRINVLGPIRITNLPPDQPDPSERQIELLCFLAVRGPSLGPEIDDALWPGKRLDGQARYGLIYRTRRAVLSANLPRTEQNEPTILGPDVTCDWHDFRRHATRGLAAGRDGIDDLKAALALVRGRPFTSAKEGTYGWADRDTDEMIATITDVAHTLSRLLIETGDTRAALSAATIGLSVDACSTRLRDDAVAAALAHGDLAEARRIQERHDALLAELDDELV